MGGGGGGVGVANEVWGRIALTEMVMHGWDLATATDSLDLRTRYARLVRVVPAEPAGRGRASWSSGARAAGRAPLLDRIVGMSGHKP